MWNESQIVRAAVALTALTAASLAAIPANAAVVYCKTAGVPQGCVARPTPVVVAPAPAPVVTPAPVVVTPVARPVVGAPVVRRARVVR